MSSDNENHNIGIAIEQINIDDSMLNNTPDLGGLSILPTRNLVLFPGVTISISLGRNLSERVAEHAYNNHLPVGIVCQRDPENDTPTLSTGIYKYGVVADIMKIIELPTGDKTLLVRAREAFHILGAGKKTGKVAGSMSARIVLLDQILQDEEMREFEAIVKSIKEKIREILPALNEPMSHMLNSLLQNGDDVTVVNVALTNFPFAIERKVKLLAQCSLKQRAMGLLRELMLKSQEMNLSMEIMRKVKADMDEEQRRAFLHQEMVNIQEQLYGDSTDDINELEQRAKSVNMPEHVAKAFNKELVKLRRINPQSPDYSVIYTYLDTLLNVPWEKESILNSNFATAREELEKDHSGLEKVKERILEQIAVLMHNPTGKAPIICLVGPPGVGKTSLGKSIAAAMGREYGRVSLGGLHDESEIRGHRRTYIGAMPGRVIDAMRRVGTINPVLVLDEIDKIGNDYKGDPSAALLEVLDPEQNCRFHDNYIDVDYDLSKVLFIATANTLTTVPQPLIDRMEVIEISGYLPEEKIEIAQNHLLRRIRQELNLEATDINMGDETIEAVIDGYTHESGVRQLEKALMKIGRKYVMNKLSNEDFPEQIQAEHLTKLLGVSHHNRFKCENNEYAGVVNGLAWTQAGGEVLLVESSLFPGKGGKLTLTGNLGEVMKESATIALQWVKAHSAQLEIEPALFDNYNLHIHFPEGAIPKDGPSAGITIATSIVSTMKQKRVRANIAMTGEITLRGRVLPVGGIKEKILAAKRAGIYDIVLSAENRKDVEDIDQRYVDGITFHYVDSVLDVMNYAITDEDVVNAIELKVVSQENA